MSMSVSWKKSFMNIAQEVATHSTCCRKQVGAVIVKDKRIISMGYNGTPSKFMHCTELFSPKEVKECSAEFLKKHGEFSRKYEIHAEMNALLYLTKSGGTSSEGASIFITLSPCQDCAKALVAAGIKEVYYHEKYDRDTEGLDFLEKANVEVNQI